MGRWEGHNETKQQEEYTDVVRRDWCKRVKGGTGTATEHAQRREKG